MFSLKNEQEIAKHKFLTTIPTLKKEWRLSFQLKATTFGTSFRQVLHMTIRGKGSGRGSIYGERTPAIWTHPTRGFYIASAVGGRYSYGKFIKGLPSINEWIQIEIGQEREGSDIIYFIIIGGTKVFSTINTKPADFENVQVFTSSPWYTSLSGSIKNLLIENTENGTSKCVSISISSSPRAESARAVTGRRCPHSAVWRGKTF